MSVESYSKKFAVALVGASRNLMRQTGRCECLEHNGLRALSRDCDWCDALDASIDKASDELADAVMCWAVGERHLAHSNAQAAVDTMGRCGTHYGPIVWRLFAAELCRPDTEVLDEIRRALASESANA